MRGVDGQSMGRVEGLREKRVGGGRGSGTRGRGGAGQASEGRGLVTNRDPPGMQALRAGWDLGWARGESVGKEWGSGRGEA